MVEILNDFQNRDIFTRTARDMLSLGNNIFTFLSDIRSQKMVKGCFFTHYNNPKEGLRPHIKVGIRYKTKEELTHVNKLLDDLCKKESKLILNPGEFQTTSGYDNRLPKDVVVDYIICHSFEWVVRIKDKLELYPSPESLGKFILQNKNEIEEEIMGPKVFRDNRSRILTCEEIGKVWERFIHHMCNACRFQQFEYQLIVFLRKNGINVFLN